MPTASLRTERVFVRRASPDHTVRSDVKRFSLQGTSAQSFAHARVEASVTRAQESAAARRDGWAQCAPSRAHLDTLDLDVNRNALVIMVGSVIQNMGNVTAPWGTRGRAAWRNVPSESTEETVKRHATASTPFAVTMSMGPVYVRPASWGPDVRKECAQIPATGYNATYAASVMPSTPRAATQ